MTKEGIFSVQAFFSAFEAFIKKMRGAGKMETGQEEEGLFFLF